MKRLRISNIASEQNRPGTYRVYNSKGRLIYTGSSKKIRNRLEALYYGRADYAQVDGKDGLRAEAHYYEAVYMPIKEARKKEKRSKRGCKYNQL